MSAALAVQIKEKEAEKARVLETLAEMQAELRALKKRRLEAEKEEEEARVLETLAEMQAESQAEEDRLFGPESDCINWRR